MQMQQKLAPKLLKMDFINGLRQQFIVHYYYYYCADMAAESAQMHWADAKWPYSSIGNTKTTF